MNEMQWFADICKISIQPWHQEMLTRETMWIDSRAMWRYLLWRRIDDKKI